MSKKRKIQIRNSTAEFLIFTSQAGEKGIEVRIEDETVWLTQKLVGVLFEKGRSTITEHLQNIFDQSYFDDLLAEVNLKNIALFKAASLSPILTDCLSRCQTISIKNKTIRNVQIFTNGE